jgi:small subunit ribosomal protein S18|uniref:Small ribosomal subunit protein bS18 n=1 Tax=Leptospirillum ferrodiazotrophum TaxID=412449 RepID=C6HX92_9BACT|nr:MAG: ribosomal protein S18 [Leptospirillum ferrodiazotrophum]
MAGQARSFQRKKVCRFCTEFLAIDYKDQTTLHSYLTERGKILPRRLTGTCSHHQRAVSRAIKQSRNVAFLAFAEES